MKVSSQLIDSRVNVNSTDVFDKSRFGNIGTENFSGSNLFSSQATIPEVTVNGPSIIGTLAAFSGLASVASNAEITGTLTTPSVFTNSTVISTVNAQNTTVANITTTNFNVQNVNCSVLNTPTLTVNSVTSDVFNCDTAITTTMDVANTGTPMMTATGPRIAVSDQLSNGTVDVSGKSYVFINNTTTQLSDLQLADASNGPNSLFIYGNIIDSQTSLPNITSYNPQLSEFDTGTGFGGKTSFLSLYSPAGNTLRYDNDGNLRIYSNPSTVVWQTTNMVSDSRMKENIEHIRNAMSIIHSLDGVYFEYIQSIYGEGNQAGFIAQDVKSVFPECIIEPEGDDVNLSIDYNRFVPVIIEGLKEIASELDIINGLCSV